MLNFGKLIGDRLIEGDHMEGLLIEPFENSEQPKKCFFVLRRKSLFRVPRNYDIPRHGAKPVVV